MKDLWIVTHSFYPSASAATARVIDLIKYLPKYNFKINILTTSTTKLPKKWKNVKLHRSPKLFNNAYLFPFYAGVHLKKKLHKNSIVIITVPTFTLSICTYFIPKKIPIITDFRDAPYSTIQINDYKWLKRTLLLLCQKRLIKKSTKVVTTTEPIGRVLGLTAPEYVVIPNGADLEKFKLKRNHEIEKLRKRFHFSKKTFVVGYLGQLNIEENPELFIESAKEVQKLLRKKIKFLLIGSGPKLLKLKKTAAASNLEEAIIFTGQVPFEEIPSYLNLTNLGFVSLNPKGTEVMLPVKVYEFLACGTPILTTLIGETKNFVRKYNIGTYSSPNPKKIARKIFNYYKLPKKKYEKLSKNCLKTARRFSRKKMAQKFNELLNVV